MPDASGPASQARPPTGTDAALMLAGVRTGRRIDPARSQEALGVRPDLSAWSKSIANGQALAAVTGTDRFRAAAASIFVTDRRHQRVGLGP